MTRECAVHVDGQIYTVTISGEYEALQVAKAAGRAVVGIWERGKDNHLEPADYIVEDTGDIDREFLERVVRRRLKLPWHITETRRLRIREFGCGDFEELFQWTEEESAWPVSAAFADQAAFESYIQCQYVFFEYGIWAVEEKETGKIIGMAGLSNLSQKNENDGDLIELGYQIFTPYRRRGYGEEACRAILHYASRCVSERICARISRDNIPSKGLAEKIGFTLVTEEDNGEMPHRCLYEWCCLKS